MNLSDRWLVRHRTTQPARLRLFCFPYAGGNSQIYRTLSQSLPGYVEVCAAALPGREKRFPEAALDRVDAIAEPLAEVLMGENDLPYAIFGHSLGAVVGFEVARKIRADGGTPPVAMFMSAHRAPQLPDPDPPIHHLPHDEFVDELRELNGTPEGVFDSPELLELILPMLRADFAAAETYTYREAAPLSCPITVFGGDGDPLIPVDQLEPWREQTSAPFAMHVFEGDHFFIHSFQNEVLAIVSEGLDAASDI